MAVQSTITMTLDQSILSFCICLEFTISGVHITILFLLEPEWHISTQRNLLPHCSSSHQHHHHHQEDAAVNWAYGGAGLAIVEKKY
jgi:hypothetical protein